MKIQSSLFEQLTLPDQRLDIDIYAAWHSISGALDKCREYCDDDSLGFLFTQWQQLSDHLLSAGQHGIYAHYLNEFQAQAGMLVDKSPEGFAVDLMRLMTKFDLVDSSILLSFSDRKIDCLDVEREALESLLKSKHYLLDFKRRNDLYSFYHLLAGYALESRSDFVTMILDDVLKSTNNQDIIHKVCIDVPHQFYRKQSKGFFPDWLRENDTRLSEKLSNYSSTYLTDSHVLYALRSGAKTLAETLYPTIGMVNDYRIALKLTDHFKKTLSSETLQAFCKNSPVRALAYIICLPEVFKGVDLSSEEFAPINMNKHLPEAVKLIRKGRSEIEHSHLANLVDDFQGNLSPKDLIRDLKSVEYLNADFRSLSKKLRRFNLESEMAL